jgi:hypothetical protein
MMKAADKIDQVQMDAETRALAAAVASARADDRAVPHEEVREWLAKIALGDFTATPPKARRL